ncbi:MAG TPA: N-acetylmuramoyl-L-alanine amidase [Fimbriimonadaceae bacterium]|nr:N-acetylmuramoyl-L-alanine amidase [Fimbriimonadaceae bacterium]
MFATLTMKRLILALVPWMAGTSWAQVLPQPVKATYAPSGVELQSCLKRGNDLLVPVAELGKLKWSVRVARGEAIVSLPTATSSNRTEAVNGRLYVGTGKILADFGAELVWDAKQDRCSIFARVSEVESGPDRVRVVSTLPVAPTVTRLENPARVVIDFPGTRLKPDLATRLSQNSRVGQFSDDTVRVVLETAKSIDLSWQYPLSSEFNLVWAGPPQKSLTHEEFEALRQDSPEFSYQDQSPVFRVAVQNFPTSGPLTRQTLGKVSATYAIRLAAKPTSPVTWSRPEPDVIQLDLAGTRFDPKEWEEDAFIERVENVITGTGCQVRLHLKQPLGAELTASANDLQLLLIKPQNADGHVSGKVIVVDAGHGGNDSGARDPAKTTNEKDLNLAISKQLSEQLASQGATVIMTRKTDVFIPLRERAEIANRNKADLFISVHINSNRTANTTSGSIIFYHGGSTLGNLLADCIRLEVKKMGDLPVIGTWSDKRIYDTGFAVLRYSKMPGVLVETGFINHRKDLAVMRSPDFQKRFATAILKGIKVYLGDGKE